MIAANRSGTRWNSSMTTGSARSRTNAVGSAVASLRTAGSSRSTKVPPVRPVTSMANVPLPAVRGPVIATTGLVAMAAASAPAILRGT